MTRTSHTLAEYETAALSLTADQARRLAETGKVVVSPAAEPGRWAVTAQQHVGSLVLADVQLLIRPKIRPDNLFLMLEVGLPEKAWAREAFDYAVTGDLLPSMVAFFARTVESTLARGVLRSYRAQQEQLVVLRGRIDLAEQVRRGGQTMPIACRFDDYTPDVAENRYLRAAIRRCLRVSRAAPADRNRLMLQLAALEEVADAPVHPDDLDALPITRLNAHYEPALRLARLLLANLTLLDQRGGTSASSFLVDMNDLFERFVAERLGRALQGRLDVRRHQAVELVEGHSGQVPMLPDLVFRRQNHAVYVADVKYKLTGDARARNADYYQLLAYTTALDLPEGVLIYCRAEGGRGERSVTVRFAGDVLHTVAVDLTGPSQSVSREFQRLAEWILQRVSTLEP